MHTIHALLTPRSALLWPALGCALLSACASLPSAGPRTAEIRAEAQTEGPRPFELVDLSPDTVAALARRQRASLMLAFGDSAAMPALSIGPGDGLSLTIWEAGSDPLFSAANVGLAATASGSARAVSIAEQIVGGDGSISVPFAGRVRVAGLNAAQAQEAIERALAGKAQKPQVIVNLSRNVSSAVTVIGEAAGGTRIPLSAHGERLLEVLAAAGGARAPSYETQIELTRAGKTVAVPLEQVLSDAQENITMQAGDLLVVTRRPETFTAFGATGRNTLINFEARQLNLIEAVAKAGGLQDQRADPRGIFLFRYEPRELAARLGAQPEALHEAQTVPVVYRLDLTKAGAYFLGQNFALQDRDMLYVANAPATELEKFLQLIGLVSQPVVSGVLVENATHN
ncbi:polysaccharide export outer membrane protein [Solimonas aquatica]|uniref:Polysaccharide export outer membrane protein n=1 Tax=Solimonas aquatica TaxID=489703 RepID=A0A1H9CMD7_9GAMM|nr:polysaccharide biosynthesis/export family protein [Solimonas aquatica]SEQ01768.1 polysaccharide export outer membrane protein [Solimonas aquatica]